MRREYIDSMPNLHATWLSRLNQHWDAVLAALPSQCAICRRWPGTRFCADCLARWSQPTSRCSLCARQLAGGARICGACLKQPPRLSHCIAALDYAYPWQSVIARYKFQADIGLARGLGRLLAAQPAAQQMLNDCDVLLPVPASEQRLRERGFDHTLLLAQAMHPSIPIWHRAVERRHTAQPQHELDRPQRLRHLQKVFDVSPDHRPRIPGKRIALLDDVMTTGATLDALADCLLKAGATGVSALVLCRTP
jgi:ComF family protein